MLLDIRRLRQLAGSELSGHLLPVVMLQILVALLSTLSVGSVLPLMAVLQAGPQGLPYLHGLSWLPIEDRQAMTLLCVAAFAVVFALKNFAAVTLDHRQATVAFMVRRSLASRLFGHYLSLPLSAIVRQNASDLAVELREGLDSTTNMTRFYMVMTGDAVVLLGVVALVVAIDPLMGCIATLALALLSRPLLVSSRAEAKKTGKVLNAALRAFMRQLADTFLIAREIRLYRSQEIFRQHFDAAQLKAAEMQRRQEHLQALPSMIVELSLVGMVLSIVTLMALSGRSEEIVRVLSVYGVAVFRVAPSINRLTMALAGIRIARVGMDAASRRLQEAGVQDGPPVASEALSGPQSAGEAAIRLVGLSYRHSASSPWLLRDVTLALSAGKTYGVRGASGTGKSTFLDLLAGLIRPVEGCIVVLGCSPDPSGGYPSVIGYVPQSVGLLNGTVRENVLMSAQAASADDVRVTEALEVAQAGSITRLTAEGLDTVIGAGGLPVSGGQRKRIGIARALVRRPALLLLDEATSSLDEQQEVAMLRAIRGHYPQMTIVLVSHRASTLALCDMVLTLEDGRLAAS